MRAVRSFGEEAVRDFLFGEKAEGGEGVKREKTEHVSGEGDDREGEFEGVEFF